MKKIASFLLVFVAIIVLSGCGKTKTVVCRKDKCLNDSSCTYRLEIKKKKVNNVTEEMTFHTAESANTYYNNLKDNKDYDIKLERQTVSIKYKGDKIINRIFVSDTKEDTVIGQL